MNELIKKLISEAVKKAGFSVPREFSVDTPPKPELGDYATNVALVLSSREKTNPKEIAEKIKTLLSKKQEIKKIEIAGPGFLNIFFAENFFLDKLIEILEQKENYGRSTSLTAGRSTSLTAGRSTSLTAGRSTSLTAGREKSKQGKVQVEYISANPTGPLHIGNARGGPIGEALANLFQFLGYEVCREFYINDIGGQIDRFAASLYYWYAKKTDEKFNFPEGGYPGKYIEELSNQIQKENKEKLTKLKDESEFLKFFESEGLREMVGQIREDAKLLGIEFDQWVYQSDFEHSGKAELVIEKLQEKGAVTKKEGALWFKNPDDPELLDRESVLQKSDEAKNLTYFADDIAYHVDKFDRGFSLVIDVWGANHHGHVPRLKSALGALEYPAEKLEIILYQYVRLKKAGKVVSMGKRLGNFVTLKQVIEEGVSADAFKYFILAQNPNTPFDFDLTLATDTSEKNPVFYIKYAHARICSILKKVKKGTEADLKSVDLKLLENEKEIALYKELIKFPELLKTIETNFQIQALPHFVYKIAGLFHEFYTECQVITTDKKLTASRLSLVLAAKYVIANSLAILGIEAPEKM